MVECGVGQQRARAEFGHDSAAGIGGFVRPRSSHPSNEGSTVPDDRADWISGHCQTSPRA
jgi:hypothetical protein